jgi:hypothetical protein
MPSLKRYAYPIPISLMIGNSFGSGNRFGAGSFTRLLQTSRTALS